LSIVNNINERYINSRIIINGISDPQKYVVEVRERG
jgi:hypothetical protein